MQLSEPARRVLFFSSLLLLTLSFALDRFFATDTTVPLPEPSALSLLAVGAVAGIALALIRRRK